MTPSQPTFKVRSVAQLFAVSVLAAAFAGVVVVLLWLFLGAVSALFSEGLKNVGTVLDVVRFFPAAVINVVKFIAAAFGIALLLGAPMGVLGGVLGGLLIIRARNTLALQNRRQRAQWGWRRGAAVGFLATLAVFLHGGDFNVVMALIGGAAGAATGALVSADCVMQSSGPRNKFRDRFCQWSRITRDWSGRGLLR